MARISLDELNRLTALGNKLVTFSLTLECPNKCRHCLVNAGSEKKNAVISISEAERYAEQMPSLFKIGIRAISFTGGEPLLASKQLQVISKGASDAGIKCGVVTSAYWATSEEKAETIVKSLPGINVWDISVDSFHEEFVSLDKVHLAYRVLKRLEKGVCLRFTIQDPLPEEDQKILGFFRDKADQSDLYLQYLRQVGRGKNIEVRENPEFKKFLFTKPCLTKGPVIRYDGSVGCCCQNLVEERQHPFQFGDARTRPLVDIVEDFKCHPLLQMMRVIGFSELMQWLEEEGLEGEVKHPLPTDVCDLCFEIFTNTKLSNYLARRAAQMKNKLRIAVLTNQVLGDNTMLNRTLIEMEKQGAEDKDFADATAYLKKLVKKL